MAIKKSEKTSGALACLFVCRPNEYARPESKLIGDLELVSAGTVDALADTNIGILASAGRAGGVGAGCVVVFPRRLHSVDLSLGDFLVSRPGENLAP